MEAIKLTCVLGRVHQAMYLDKERPIGVRLYLDHILGGALRHRATRVVRGQEDFAKAALACGGGAEQLPSEREGREKTYCMSGVELKSTI